MFSMFVCLFEKGIPFLIAARANVYFIEDKTAFTHFYNKILYKIKYNLMNKTLFYVYIYCRKIFKTIEFHSFYPLYFNKGKLIINISDLLEEKKNQCKNKIRKGK